MAKIQYIEHKFKPDTLKKIKQANSIIAEYQADKIQLTLRQLYYQFVARNIIKNNQREYDNLQRCITNARRAGLIDWSAITDRTRNLVRVSTWDSPADIISSAAWSYREELWAGQKYQPIVMIEKDAAIGTVERVCSELRVPYMSNRGYVSDAELHEQALAIERLQSAGKVPVVLYCGDFDPSGWDMTRDIDERFNMFIGGCQIQRLVLNPEQIAEYNPPPNFVKQTDSRANKFMEEHNTEECYELDAVPPREIVRLIREAVLALRDEKAWKIAAAREQQRRAQLEQLSASWQVVTDYLGTLNGDGARKMFIMSWSQLCDFFDEFFSCDGECDGDGSTGTCTHAFTFACESCFATSTLISSEVRAAIIANEHEQPACSHCGYNSDQSDDEDENGGDEDNE